MASSISDKDEKAPELSELEQASVQFFRNFQDAIQKRNLQRIKEDIDNSFPDLSLLSEQFDYIASSSVENAILSCIAVSDDLLKEMFRRETRPTIEINSMLSPLGPLGDFRKRLMVAAIANYIDDYDLQFLDGLRKLRNNIAHAAIPKPPDSGQISNLLDVLPDLIDMLLETGKMSFDRVQSPSDILRAMMLWQIAQLAWKTVVYPQMNKNGVPLSLFLKDPHEKFGAISLLARKGALKIFKGELIAKKPK